MLKAKAWKLGDDIDTDVIIPARHLTSSDPEVLKAHCMEDLDPEFASRISPGDMIVAGANFGCGSSREHAPMAIKAAGISCVIAKSFARIFFRNSFNIGLPILESKEAAENIENGDEVEADLATGLIKDLTKGTEYRTAPVPGFMRELVEDGGLIPHVKKRLDKGEVQKPLQDPDKTGDEQARKGPGARMKELEQEEKTGKDAPWVEEQEESRATGEEALIQELEAGEAEEEEE